MRNTITKLFGTLFVLALLVSLAKPFASEAATVGAPTVSSVKKAGDTGIKVTWKSVDGATGYRVYRKTANDKAYVKVATTSKLSYTDKKWTADAGTSIKYVVKAYVKKDGKTSWSTKSKAKSYKVPSAPVADKPENILLGTWGDEEGNTVVFDKPGTNIMFDNKDKYTYRFFGYHLEGIFAFSKNDGEEMLFDVFNPYIDEIVEYLKFAYSNDTLRVLFINPDEGTTEVVEYKRVQ